MIFFGLFCISRLAGAETKANLIANGGFESGFEGWGKVNMGLPEHKFNIGFDDKVFHSGKKSLFMEYLGGPSSGYVWLDQKVSIKKGHSYKLSLYTKLENVRSVQEIHVKWAGVARYIAYPIASGTCDWRKFEYYFQATADAVTVSLVFMGRGKIWFDDLELSESPLPKGSEVIVRDGIVFQYMPRSKADDPLTATTEEEKKRGYLVYSRQNPWNTHYTSIPGREEMTAELRIAATPGEYEPAWFSVYALDGLRGVKVSLAGDLKNEKGAMISRDLVDVRTVKCWPQRTDWAAASYFVIPELLEKFKTVDVPKESTRSFWLTVKVPRGTKPGDYLANILIEPAPGRQFTLPLKLKVLPFELREPKDRFWVMWTSDNGYDRMSRADLRRELEDMKEHGINSVLFYAPGLKDAKFVKTESGMTFSSAKLAEIQELRKELRLDGPLHLYWGPGLEEGVMKAVGKAGAKINWDDREIFETVKDGFKAVDRFVKKTGGKDYGEWYYLGWDEPQIYEGGPKQAVFEHRVAKAAGIKDLVTTCEGEVASQLLPLVAGMCWAGGPDSMEANRSRQKAGPEYWWYGSGVYTGQEGGLMPNRYYCGMLFYKSGAIGEVGFIYTRTEATGDPFDDFDGNKHPEPKDAFIVYPSPDGNIPTLQWEGIREGIDDYKYLYTLEELIAAGKKEPSKKILAEKVEAKFKALVDSCRWGAGNINADSPFSTIVDNAKAMEIRRQIVDMIMELQ
ncbi:MAG: DUF6067 family protein [Verrucomicrobiae bacterium]|nr:DUF6067 family protein [Verrucomicrobiae bacterium]